MPGKQPSKRAKIAARIVVGIGAAAGVAYVASKVPKVAGARFVLGIMGAAVTLVAHEQFDAPVAQFLSDQGL